MGSFGLCKMRPVKPGICVKGLIFLNYKQAGGGGGGGGDPPTAAVLL